MPKTTKEKLAAIKADYEYVKRTYGDVIDFTGSGMEATQLETLLSDPSIETAVDCVKERLISLYEDGYEVSDRESKALPYFDDERLQEIGDRHLLPIPDVELA